MAMPVLAVEVAFGDAWNVASPTWWNVTEYVRDNPPLRISRGRERITRPRPGSLTLTLSNNDRRFDPDYTSGPYGNYEQYLSFDGANATRIDMPDDATTSITGDFDLAVLIDPDDWTPAAQQTWGSKWNTTGNQRSYLIAVTAAGNIVGHYSTTGANAPNDLSTAATGFSPGTKQWIRWTMDVDDGGGNHVSKFYTAPATSSTDFSPGSWSQVGTTVTTAGAVSIYDSTSLLALGGHSSGATQQPIGKGYGLLLNNAYDTADLWTSADIKLMVGQSNPSSGVGWPTDQISGGDDSTSQKTWTIRGTVQPTMTQGTQITPPSIKPMTPIRVRATHNSTTYDLFRGFVSEWRIDTTDGKDSTATVTAVDGLSVLELLRSPSGYEAEVATDAPLGWWKLDETSGTTATDSGSAGVNGTYTNTPTLNQSGPMSGMEAVDFDEPSSEYVSVGSLTGSQCDETWTIEGWFNEEGLGGESLQPIVEIGTYGSPTYPYAIYYDAIQSELRIIYPTSATTRGYKTLAAASAGAWHHFAVVFVLGSLGWKVYLDGSYVGLVVDSAFSNTVLTGAMVVNIARMTSVGAREFNGKLAQIAIYQSELSATRIAAHAGKTFNGFSSELTSARATSALDLVGWPSADRTISTGLTTVAAGTSSTTALGTIWEAVDSEDSECFVSGAGKVVFTNRDSRGGSSISATFSNDGSDTPYQGLRWSRDDSLVRTVVAVTDSAGDTLEVTDATNEAIYGPRTLSRTTYTTSATEPTELAYWLLGEYKDPLTQVELLLEAGAGTSNAIWAELLSRELGDLVNVEVKPVGGTTQNDWDMFVEQIDLTAAVDFWQTRLGLSNAQGQGTFTLDNAVFGQLDGPGRLGF